MPLPIIVEADINGLLAELNAAAEGDLLALDGARRAAVAGYHHIHACPGAGKTTLIGLKLILLARKWLKKHSGICVLTHTNVAKEEILRRVRNDAAGRSLLGYPHFIGTIQDFVQTFLAFPACRSKGYPIRRIDDDAAIGFLESRLTFGTRAYLQNSHLTVAGLRLIFADGALSIAVPGNPGAHTASFQNMMQAKNQALESGCFFFSEMYALARELISANPSIVDAMRLRFPLVLIDEMQDTQRFQDDLINLIFDPEAGCAVQKIGDPDQAIFDGMGDAPNDTFNGAAHLAPIPDSGRFTADIAEKIRGLSTRGVALVGAREPLVDGPTSSFILYDDATINQVLPRFGAIVSLLPEAERRVVKVVGGRAEDGPLNIRSYWPAFDRTRALKAPAPDTFCGVLRRSVEHRHGHAAGPHLRLRQAIVELLRLAERTTINRSGNPVAVTIANLSQYFAQIDRASEYRALLAEMLMRSSLDAAAWNAQTARICAVCGIDAVTPAVAPYLAYSDIPQALEDPTVSPGNVFTDPNGVSMEVSTIHAIKGETHDATLILETKFSTQFDIREMIPFFINPDLQRPVFDPEHPKTAASNRAKFMKRTYVAASRPRHLVCVAMHRDRLSAEQRAALADQRGWVILDLAEVGDAVAGAL